MLCVCILLLYENMKKKKNIYKYEAEIWQGGGFLEYKCVSLCICTEDEKNIQKPLQSMSKGKSENALGM